VLDWTRDFDSGSSNQDNSDQVMQRKHWRLGQCQNGKFTYNHEHPSFFITDVPQINMIKYYCSILDKPATVIIIYLAHEIVGLRIFEELLEDDILVGHVFFPSI